MSAEQRATEAECKLATAREQLARFYSEPNVEGACSALRELRATLGLELPKRWSAETSKRPSARAGR